MGTADDVPVEARATAPQSPYSLRQVGIGFTIFAVALALLIVLALLV